VLSTAEKDKLRLSIITRLKTLDRLQTANPVDNMYATRWNALQTDFTDEHALADTARILLMKLNTPGVKKDEIDTTISLMKVYSRRTLYNRMACTFRSEHSGKSPTNAERQTWSATTPAYNRWVRDFTNNEIIYALIEEEVVAAAVHEQSFGYMEDTIWFQENTAKRSSMTSAEALTGMTVDTNTNRRASYQQHKQQQQTPPNPAHQPKTGATADPGVHVPSTAHTREKTHTKPMNPFLARKGVNKSRIPAPVNEEDECAPQPGSNFSHVANPEHVEQSAETHGDPSGHSDLLPFVGRTYVPPPPPQHSHIDPFEQIIQEIKHAYTAFSNGIINDNLKSATIEYFKYVVRKIRDTTPNIDIHEPMSDTTVQLIINILNNPVPSHVRAFIFATPPATPRTIENTPATRAIIRHVFDPIRYDIDTYQFHKWGSVLPLLSHIYPRNQQNPAHFVVKLPQNAYDITLPEEEEGDDTNPLLMAIETVQGVVTANYTGDILRATGLITHAPVSWLQSAHAAVREWLPSWTPDWVTVPRVSSVATTYLLIDSLDASHAHCHAFLLHTLLNSTATPRRGTGPMTTTAHTLHQTLLAAILGFGGSLDNIAGAATINGTVTNIIFADAVSRLTTAELVAVATAYIMANVLATTTIAATISTATIVAVALSIYRNFKTPEFRAKQSAKWVALLKPFNIEFIALCTNIWSFLLFTATNTAYIGLPQSVVVSAGIVGATAHVVRFVGDPGSSAFLDRIVAVSAVKYLGNQITSTWKSIKGASYWLYESRHKVWNIIYHFGTTATYGVVSAISIIKDASFATTGIFFMIPIAIICGLSMNSYTRKMVGASTEFFKGAVCILSTAYAQGENTAANISNAFNYLIHESILATSTPAQVVLVSIITCAFISGLNYIRARRAVRPSVPNPPLIWIGNDVPETKSFVDHLRDLIDRFHPANMIGTQLLLGTFAVTAVSFFCFFTASVHYTGQFTKFTNTTSTTDSGAADILIRNVVAMTQFDMTTAGVGSMFTLIGSYFTMFKSGIAVVLQSFKSFTLSNIPRIVRLILTTISPFLQSREQQVSSHMARFFMAFVTSLMPVVAHILDVSGIASPYITAPLSFGPLILYAGKKIHAYFRSRLNCRGNFYRRLTIPNPSLTHDAVQETEYDDIVIAARDRPNLWNRMRANASPDNDPFTQPVRGLLPIFPSHLGAFIDY
jgi:hypothetical protein